MVLITVEYCNYAIYKRIMYILLEFCTVVVSVICYSLLHTFNGSLREHSGSVRSRHDHSLVLRVLHVVVSCVGGHSCRLPWDVEI